MITTNKEWSNAIDSHTPVTTVMATSAVVNKQTNQYLSNSPIIRIVQSFAFKIEFELPVAILRLLRLWFFEEIDPLFQLDWLDILLGFEDARGGQLENGSFSSLVWVFADEWKFLWRIRICVAEDCTHCTSIGNARSRGWNIRSRCWRRPFKWQKRLLHGRLSLWSWRHTWSCRGSIFRE